MQGSDWQKLSIAPGSLRDARLQCHTAIQANTRLARAGLKAEADDSHTNLGWDFAAGALVGQAPFGLGLRIADLTLIAGEASFALDGKTFGAALQWVADVFGVSPGALEQPLNFELDPHAGKFDLASDRAAFEELSRWYHNAAIRLESFGEPVRCWPHHFDIAASLKRGEGSIGVGLSPGDGSYDEPYFYVSPWPYPDAAGLPALSAGHWHTQEWTGAVLTAGEILRGDDQHGLVRKFLDTTVRAVAGERSRL